MNGINDNLNKQIDLECLIKSIFKKDVIISKEQRRITRDRISDIKVASEIENNYKLDCE